MMKNILLICFILSYLFSQGQGIESHTIPIKVKDGIYISQKDFSNQNPILKEQIISTEFTLHEDFYFKVLNAKKLYYFAENSMKESAFTKDIWAYVNQGNFYINYNGDFHRLSYIGNISPLISTEETNTSAYDYPYRFNSGPGFGINDPTLSMYIPAEKVSIQTIQMVFDFESNSFYKFTFRNVEQLINNDSLLHEKYNSLNRRKKRKLKYYYIRVYNENNPIKFIHI